jgi:hypothetical protein
MKKRRSIKLCKACGQRIIRRNMKEETWKKTEYHKLCDPNNSKEKFTGCNEIKRKCTLGILKIRKKENRKVKIYSSKNMSQEELRKLVPSENKR